MTAPAPATCVAAAAGAAADWPGDAAVTPIWSVMVPTYRPTAHLREALLPVVEAGRRWRGRMQIEVVDDASPDVDVAALLAGWGLDGVAVHRRDVNGGLAACWNTCIERARGTWVHLLHQDDFVATAFYERMEALASEHPQAGMLVCRNVFLAADATSLSPLVQEEAGPIPRWLEQISARQLVQCPAAVVRRDLYHRIGGYDGSLRYVIDWEMWVRVAMAATVAYLPEPLATYRIHAGAESRRLAEAGQVIPDFVHGLRLVRSGLLRHGRPDCARAAALYAMEVCGGLAIEAQQNQGRDAAMAILLASLRHFGLQAGWRSAWQRLRWYLSLRLRRGAGKVNGRRSTPAS